MNNKVKMAIKSVPVVSGIAKGLNRTVGITFRHAVRYPSMRELNVKLVNSLQKLNDANDMRIWYFGVPVHQNLGDQAQKFVIEKWLENNYPMAEIIKIPSQAFNAGTRRVIRIIKKFIQPNDLIVMQSGHTMDGLHDDETPHRLASTCFPDNRIIFFPTSIRFNSKRGKELDRKAIGSHVNTLFLARDAVSAQIARDLYPRLDVRLYPDVVTSMIGKYSFDNQREGVLLCARNDGEKLYSYAAIDKLASALSGLCDVSRTDTTVKWDGIDLDSHDAWTGIEGVIESYSQKCVIVTDRYHGTIFARIAGTPVVVLKTNDHKVVSGAKWFTDAGDKGIVVADNLEEVPGLVSDFMKRFPDGVSAPAFAADYYDGLKSVIEEM